MSRAAGRGGTGTVIGADAAGAGAVAGTDTGGGAGNGIVATGREGGSGRSGFTPRDPKRGAGCRAVCRASAFQAMTSRR